MSVMRGGRAAAEAALAKLNPAAYARSRNFLDGAVTRLSPYLRHGVLTLAEVRDRALQSVDRAEDAEKFVSELGWRDYWQRLYALLGKRIWNDVEAYKTGYPAGGYAAVLPEALIEGQTGLACMDAFSAELREKGYLHNHARMWMAAYTVHWLRVRWQAGARWFLEHLLDGDPASNNLSWQWVASTFSQKAYFFNRENLERYTGGVYCQRCAVRGSCVFEGSYEELEGRLFPRLGTGTEEVKNPIRLVETVERKPIPLGSKPLLWVHTEALNPTLEMFVLWPDAQACFVWDEEWLREERISEKRVRFLQECLAEMPVRMSTSHGEIAREIVKAARATGADCVLAMRGVDVRLLAAAEAIEKEIPLVWLEWPQFVDDSRGYDLRRFSRYWSKAKASAMVGR